MTSIDKDHNDIDQYNNLIKYRNNIKKFILEELNFNNVTYKFYGIIFMESSNHYTSYCNICLNGDLNLQINKSYYYNDLIENGKVHLIEADNFEKKFNRIIDYNPFIILFIKKTNIYIKFI